MCQRNWRQYNASLVQRGSLSFFCHPGMIKTLKKACRQQKKGGRPPYSQQLILVLVLLKISYGLSYRGCQGMAVSLFAAHKIRIPSYSTICRGIKRLTNVLPRLTKRRPHTLLFDSSGFKVTGEGEWKTKVHGRSYRRSWLKVHLVVDSKTNEIVDLIVTSPSEADINVGLRLLKRISSAARQLFADGAYDGWRFRRHAYDQGIEAIVPPPTNAKLRAGRCLTTRNDAIRVIKGLGDDKSARQLWGKLTGYCHRVKVESAFSRLKRLFGAGVFSRGGAAQSVEVWLKALLSNIWLGWYRP